MNSVDPTLWVKVKGVSYSVSVLENDCKDFLKEGIFRFTLKFHIIKRKHIQISIRKKIL